MPLRIDVEWQQGSDPDPRLSASAAALRLCVGNTVATRIFDGWSKTVVDSVRVPVFPIAEWLAFNWWRIRAEPPHEDSDATPNSWQLAHDLPGIGGGYVWPRIRFASDTRSIIITARAIPAATWEPVRYLDDVHPTVIGLADFDREIDGFIELTLERLRALDVDSEPLRSIWADVLAERADPEVAEWRTWEARLGYGPEEAPEHMVRAAQSLTSSAGADAAAEVAPLLGDGITAGALLHLAGQPGIWSELPANADLVRPMKATTPWDTGRELAHRVRKKFRLSNGRIADSKLAEILGIAENQLREAASTADTPELGLAVRGVKPGKTVLHFRRRNTAGRRFEAARFLADSLVAPKGDLWLPLTDLGTARQKVQRAFAAELLAPIGALMDFLGKGGVPSSFDDAAEYFGVSEVAIRSQLANHGHLPAF